MRVAAKPCSKPSGRRSRRLAIETPVGSSSTAATVQRFNRFDHSCKVPVAVLHLVNALAVEHLVSKGVRVIYQPGCGQPWATVKLKSNQGGRSEKIASFYQGAECHRKVQRAIHG